MHHLKGYIDILYAVKYITVSHVPIFISKLRHTHFIARKTPQLITTHSQWHGPWQEIWGKRVWFIEIFLRHGFSCADILAAFYSYDKPGSNANICVQLRLTLADLEGWELHPTFLSEELSNKKCYFGHFRAATPVPDKLMGKSNHERPQLPLSKMSRFACGLVTFSCHDKQFLSSKG